MSIVRGPDEPPARGWLGGQRPALSVHVTIYIRMQSRGVDNV